MNTFDINATGLDVEVKSVDGEKPLKTITPPVTPSETYCLREIETTEILVMYGSKTKKYYSTDCTGYHYKTLPDGEYVYINPKFVVSKKDVTVVCALTDSTKHTNYKSRKCESSKIKSFYLIPNGFDYEFVYDRSSKNKRPLDIVKPMKDLKSKLTITPLKG